MAAHRVPEVYLLGAPKAGTTSLALQMFLHGVWPAVQWGHVAEDVGHLKEIWGGEGVGNGGEGSAAFRTRRPTPNLGFCGGLPLRAPDRFILHQEVPSTEFAPFVSSPAKFACRGPAGVPLFR